VVVPLRYRHVTYVVSGEFAAYRAIQSPAFAGPFVTSTVTCDPAPTDTAVGGDVPLTVICAGDAMTVTVPLVASRPNPLFANTRNS
jgi:hypothetical protein